jgi:hypothetical protein
MHMPDLHRLLVAPPIAVKGVDLSDGVDTLDDMAEGSD